MFKLRKFALLLAVVFAALALTFGSAAAQSDLGNDGIDFDCSQLGEGAQEYFFGDGGSIDRNVDDLDRDSDGFACDSAIDLGTDDGDDSTPVASPAPGDDGDDVVDGDDDGNGNGDDGNGDDDDKTVVVLPSTGTGDSDGSMVSYAVIIAGAALVAVAAMGSLRHRAKN